MKFLLNPIPINIVLDVDTFEVIEIDEEKNLVKNYFRNSGNQYLYILYKKNYSTDIAIRDIVRYNKLKYKDIGFAGMKDKRATTWQRITSPKQISFNSENIKIIYAGKSEKLRLGDLWGNKFIVKTIDLTDRIKELDEKFPNYYGDQRFSKTNLEIGIELLKGNLEEALNLYISKEDKKFLRHERYIRNLLKDKRPEQVWRIIPRNLSMMFIHAVQSYIFNRELDLRIENQDYQEFISLIGYNSELNRYNSYIMEELQITKQMFKMEKLSFLKMKGDKRKMFSRIYDYKYSESLEFSLEKGCYATVALEQMIGKKLKSN
jgi:tRNA pseudouridine13 synthase